MKKIKVKFSQHEMTRCQSCSRHQHIDSALSNAELLSARCRSSLRAKAVGGGGGGADDKRCKQCGVV